MRKHHSEQTGFVCVLSQILQQLSGGVCAGLCTGVRLVDCWHEVSQDRKMTSSHAGDHSVSFILTEEDSGLKLGRAQLCAVGLGK